MPPLGHSGCARRSGVSVYLSYPVSYARKQQGSGPSPLPVAALYILATLSMLPMMKYEPSGDQARSYISEPDDRHMCFVRQLSLSSKPSLPKAGLLDSEGTQMMTFPSSPAEARVSPEIRLVRSLSAGAGKRGIRKYFSGTTGQR